AVCTLRFFASPICCHPFEDDSLNYPVVTVSKGGSTIDTADSLRISFRLAPDTDQMVGPRALTITMQPEGAPLRLSIIRAVCDEHGRWHEEHLSSDTRIADLASCMMEKARQ
ncbi:hypothetical protein, partial [Pseudomonas aeruginosa]